MSDPAGGCPGDVLRFFDALALEQPSLQDILRRTAAWTGRTVAARGPDGLAISADPSAQIGTEWPAELAQVSAPHGSTVGLGPPAGPHDTAVLDRLAFVVGLAEQTARRAELSMSEERAVELLIRSEESRQIRTRAVERLGFSLRAGGRVLLACADPETLDAVAARLRSGCARVVRGSHRRLTVFVTVGGDPAQALADVPRGAQLGLGTEHPLLAADQSFAEALAAFRFSQPSPRDRGPYLIEEGVAVRFDQLGGYDMFTEALTPALIDRIDDVRAVDRALVSAGPELLATLDVVVSTPSIRQAARLLGVHHNSVAHRVTQAERILGFSLADSYGRSRLFLALTLRRLRETAALLH